MRCFNSSYLQGFLLGEMSYRTRWEVFWVRLAYLFGARTVPLLPVLRTESSALRKLLFHSVRKRIDPCLNLINNHAIHSANRHLIFITTCRDRKNCSHFPATLSGFYRFVCVRDLILPTRKNVQSVAKTEAEPRLKFIYLIWDRRQIWNLCRKS